MIDKSLQVDSLIFTCVSIFLFAAIGLSGLYFQIKIQLNTNNEDAINKAVSYPILIILLTFCLLGFSIAISSVLSDEYTGLVGLLFPALILPVWIYCKRHFKEKKAAVQRVNQAQVYHPSAVLGSTKSHSNTVYLAIFILLITSPLSYAEVTSTTQYSWVSYFIFSLAIFSLLIIFHARLTAIAYKRTGDIFLITETEKFFSNKKLTGRIEGVNLPSSKHATLTLTCLEVDKSRSGLILNFLVSDTATINLSKHGAPSHFNFSIPENAQKIANNSKLQINFDLKLQLSFAINLNYTFDSIEASLIET